MILGLGLDLVDIGRVAAVLDRHPARARRRLFTPGEVAYCDRRTEPARVFAARFAAKEARYKALAGTPEARLISWQDLEVVSDPDGRPRLVLHGAAAARAAELGVRQAHLTLTHADGMAAAVVVLDG